MKISDLLSPTDVMIDVRASNKRLLLQELAAKAASNLGLGVDRVAPYLLQREELGSTGIGGGVAIPHARLPDLQRPYGLLAKLKQPLEFDAIDGRAVDIVFVLLLPANTENGQLGALAFVARSLRISETIIWGGWRKRRRDCNAAQALPPIQCASGPTHSRSSWPVPRGGRGRKRHRRRHPCRCCGDGPERPRGRDHAQGTAAGSRVCADRRQTGGGHRPWRSNRRPG
jgi:nitrogen PTS system EIIA component